MARKNEEDKERTKGKQRILLNIKKNTQDRENKNITT